MTYLRNKVKSLETKSPINVFLNVVEGKELFTLTDSEKSSLKTVLYTWAILLRD